MKNLLQHSGFILFPVINEVWEGEQRAVFSDLKDKELWLSGDGRCDSPGHSAKYGTYTMLDQKSDKIVDFHIVQVSEVSSTQQQCYGKGGI